jgi:hypothetical protein
MYCLQVAEMVSGTPLFDAREASSRTEMREDLQMMAKLRGHFKKSFLERCSNVKKWFLPNLEGKYKCVLNNSFLFLLLSTHFIYYNTSQGITLSAG